MPDIPLTRRQLDFVDARIKRAMEDGIRFDHTLRWMLQAAYVQGFADCFQVTKKEPPDA